MHISFLDHITVVAPSLEAGAAWIKERLGVEPQPGGEHARMGTHNRLLHLGESMYLEVIAVNPAAPKPHRPRWFALDLLEPDSPPKLAAWVARTGDIHAAVSVSPEPLGAVEAMSRGALEWLITIPADGSLPLDGVAPALIEWHTDTHPALLLDDLGLSLVKLELHHPEPERVDRLLRTLKIGAPVVVSERPAQAPSLVAHIETPLGIRTL